MALKIGKYEICNNKSNTFIIAELSANHGNDINIAKKTIDAVKYAGADAIKLQTYTADTITIDCDNDYFKIKNSSIWDGRTLYDLYKEAHTPWEWQKELKEYAESIGLICFSTPFDKSSVDFLETLNVPAYKVASFEITDIPLIEYIASKGKPIIISTGMATLSNIEEAINACKKMGNDKIILLQCTSAYPANIEDANLKTIQNLRDTFNVEVGLSDHTLGIVVPIVAVALGAKVIEKHFILDKSIGGPDAIFSLNKNEFKDMVDAIRIAEKSIGKINYNLSDKIANNKQFSRSLFVIEDIKAGETFTEKNVKSIRPGFGLPSKYINDIIGKTCRKNLQKGIPLKWEYVK
ncbi:pseudaminic acid synthase [Clostridium sporogenes]|nr:pseudaminic acid synthase [Clostridium sporogenes]NFS24556.1 pseudaminic acid synthase [Clostridium sporogenes]